MGVYMAAYRKFIKGSDNHDNQQNEQLSHNRISVEGGPAAVVLVIFFCVVATASIIMMAVIHLQLVEALVAGTFVGFFVCLWIVGLSFTVRHVSATKTAVAVDEVAIAQARIEKHVIKATDAYILYEDPDGSYQFRGTVHVDEHRQFLPKEISTPAPTEAILTCYDHGMSGRGIEKWLSKDGTKVKYRDIAKTLDLYRPDWTKKYTVESDSGEENL